jgi:hypothetical protein
MDHHAYWTTSAQAPAEQFTHWRELICEAFLALTPESDLRGGFAGSVTQWRLGELSLARIESQRQTVHRTEAGVQRDPIRGYYANLQVSGTSLMAQHGRVATLRPGDIAVVDADEPFRFEFGGDFRQLSLFVPARTLTTAGPVRTATAVDTTTGVGAAVRHSLETLTRGPLQEHTAARLALHAAGMLSIALEPSILTPVRSPRSYQTCIDDIAEHLTDEDLSPAATARRLGISVRTSSSASGMDGSGGVDVCCSGGIRASECITALIRWAASGRSRRRAAYARPARRRACTGRPAAPRARSVARRIVVTSSTSSVPASFTVGEAPAVFPTSMMYKLAYDDDHGDS